MPFCDRKGSGALASSSGGAGVPHSAPSFCARRARPGLGGPPAAVPGDGLTVRTAYDGTMPNGGEGSHTLVVYGPSARADAELRQLAETSSERGGRVTAVKLVAQESEARGCCDRRSVMWNEISRDLAREALARARLAVEGHEGVQLDVVLFSGRRADEVVVREALARDADEVVLADPRATPLGRLALRRLRRTSPVTVRD
jgi:hypothetical protein